MARTDKGESHSWEGWTPADPRDIYNTRQNNGFDTDTWNRRFSPVKSSKKSSPKITGQQLLDMLNAQNQGPFVNLPATSSNSSTGATSKGLIYRGNQPNFVELNNQAGYNDPRSGASNADGSATSRNTSGPVTGWSHMASPGKGGKSNPGMPDGNSGVPPTITDTFKATYDGPSAAKMAHDEFVPQYELLDNQRKQTAAKYKTAGHDVGGMYDALAKAMRGEQAGIKTDNAATTSKIGGAYNDAIQATKTDAAKDDAQVAAMARRLGVDAAMPDAQAQSNDTTALLTGLLAANKANQTSVSTQLGQNEVDYNRNSADSANMAGVNARSDFASQALDANNNFDNQQLQLKGAEGTAKNKYGLTIADMLQQSQLAHDKIAADQQQAQMAALAKAQQDAADNEFRQAQLGISSGQLDLANDKFKASQEAAANKPAAVSKDPYVVLAQTADHLYNGNKVASGNAVKAVQDAFARGGHFATAQDFVKYLLSRNGGGHPQDAAQLMQLGTNFYNALASGGAGKPIGSGASY
jgi:hypothetical protein